MRRCWKQKASSSPSRTTRWKKLPSSPRADVLRLLDEISFEGPDLKKKTVRIDAAYVQKKLADIVKNQDLSRYIL